MRLSALHGNALKVYLALIETRNAQDVCRLSHRALSETVCLSRNTVLQALRHLEHHGMILRKEDGWLAAMRPVAGLLVPVGGSEIEPPASGEGSKTEPPASKRDEGGSKIEPPRVDNLLPGSEIEPPAPSNGSKIEPPLPKVVQKLNHPPPALTRARTSRSSSSEEDSICTAVPPSSSSLLPSSRGREGGRGGSGGRKPRRGEKQIRRRAGEEREKDPTQ